MSESFGGDWQDGDGFAVVNSWVNSRVNPTQWLDIESYTEWGGPTQPGTYTFTDQDASYKTCSLCIVAYVEYESPTGWVEKAFMPVGGTSGQAVITSIDTKPNPTGSFAGSLDVMMREVKIDEKTWETTPVEGGCTGKLAFQWNTPTKRLSR